jgi:hypothetical protein
MASVDYLAYVRPVEKSTFEEFCSNRIVYLHKLHELQAISSSKAPYYLYV